MKDFAVLFEQLEGTTKTNEKVKALTNYFENASNEDRLWAIALFTGRRPRGVFSSRQIRELIARESKLPSWLIEECYQNVGDLAETAALLVQSSSTIKKENSAEELQLSDYMLLILSLKKLSDAEKSDIVALQWKLLETSNRLLFNKFITGGFRIGVSEKLVVKALSKVLNRPENELYHCLMGNWEPSTITFEQLFFNGNEDGFNNSKPYPFCLAFPAENPTETLGNLTDYQVEWKWDGIRIQLIKRKGEIFLWSRGEELLTDKFPEIVSAAQDLPDGTVLDGELLSYKDGSVQSFALLQTRISRKALTKKILEEAAVAVFAYDLLEYNNQDIRDLSLQERRELLEDVLLAGNSLITPSPILSESNWAALAKRRNNSEAEKAEGLMIKTLSAPYATGRKRGYWWKWKLDPKTIDAVLIYAQKGHGRRATLYTDFTFALWDADKLVTFTKAYSGLTDSELIEVDAFIKKNTLEKFGPVRTVNPILVFEIGFEGIQVSNRHKSGVALRFPRIIAWRKDKKASEADTLQTLKLMAGIQ